MAKYGAAIAHCPLSNFYFADVLLKVKHCLQLGVKVRLPSCRMTNMYHLSYTAQSQFGMLEERFK